MTIAIGIIITVVGIIGNVADNKAKGASIFVIGLGLGIIIGQILGSMVNFR